MRRLENYVRKYGPEFGPMLYHALQSQAAHAGVSARLRRKIDVLLGKTPAPPRKSLTVTDFGGVNTGIHPMTQRSTGFAANSRDTGAG